jgi:regulator of sigma E protease
MVVVHFIIVLGILIFVHELGHFIVAKLMGVKVEKFSLGFGPKIFGRQVGETEYLISAFPLGGYVKMFGETGIVEGGAPGETGEGDGPVPEPRELTPAEQARSFSHKSPWQRMAIVLAGPAFNLVFAWLILVVLSMIAFPVMTPRLGKILPDKPAARAGVQKDDLIRSIAGKQIIEWDEIAPALAATKGEIVLEVERAGAVLPLRVIPEQGTTYTLFGEQVSQPIIGVAPAYEVKDVRFSPLQALTVGTRKAGKYVEITALSIVKMFQGSVPLNNIGGPLQIADMANQAAKRGGSNFFLFLALISVNLGVLNLLPVPVLDGGHLLFFSLEIVLRRPVSQKAREYAQQVGLFLLLGLMVLAFYNDIIRYIVKPG